MTAEFEPIRKKFENFLQLPPRAQNMGLHFTAEEIIVIIAELHNQEQEIENLRTSLGFR